MALRATLPQLNTKRQSETLNNVYKVFVKINGRTVTWKDSK